MARRRYHLIPQVLAPATPSWPAQLPAVVNGVAYSFTLTAYGGTPPYTWYVQPGFTLPAGLSLNPATGLISGTPSVSATLYAAMFGVADSSAIVTDYGPAGETLSTGSQSIIQ